MRRLEGSNLSQTWWEAPKVGATGKRHPLGTPETLWIHRTSLGRPRNFHLDPKSGHNAQCGHTPDHPETVSCRRLSARRSRGFVCSSIQEQAIVACA